MEVFCCVLSFSLGSRGEAKKDGSHDTCDIVTIHWLSRVVFGVTFEHYLHPFFERRNFSADDRLRLTRIGFPDNVFFDLVANTTSYCRRRTFQFILLHLWFLSSTAIRLDEKNSVRSPFPSVLPFVAEDVAKRINF